MYIIHSIVLCHNCQIIKSLSLSKLVLISNIQLKSDQTKRLLNKPYVNEVTLTGQNPPLKYCQLLELLTHFDEGLRSFNIGNTRKYPLRGYILGVLTHTTALDRLWGGDVFLRLHIRSSADHVILKSSIHSSASPRSAALRLGFWKSDQMV